MDNQSKMPDQHELVRNQKNQNPSRESVNEALISTTQPTTQPSIPDGGTIAWLHVLGVFFCWFNSWGLTNAFGVFQTYYEESLLTRSTPSQISWIGSIQPFLLLFVGVLSGPLYDAGYFRPLLWTGSFLVTFGYFMTSLCKQYWQVMLAQGLCIGIGTGCLFVPSVSILPQYFVKRRALVNGLAASGSSAGGVIYPIVVHRLIPQIGFPWTVRVVAFMVLATQAIPVIILRVRVKPKQKRVLFDVKAFTDAPFALFTLAMFLSLMGLYIPTFYVQSFALAKDLTSNDLSAYILPILNTGGVFGRIVPNFFADRTGSLNMLLPCISGASILTFVWIAVVNQGGLIVFALIYGFFSGTILSLPPMVIVSLAPRLEVIATRMGTSFAAASIGLLIGTPISGAILNKTHKYTGLQAFGGAILLGAAFFVFSARFTKARLHFTKV